MKNQTLGLKKLFWDSTYNFTRQGFGIILGIITSIFLARGLGVEARGIYALVVLLPTIVTAFANLGISPATVFLVAHKEISDKDIIPTNLILTIISSVIGIAVSMVLIFGFGNTIFPGVNREYLLIATINVPVMMIATNLTAILQGKQDFRTYNLLTIFPQVTNLIFAFVLVWLLRLGIGGAVIMNLTSAIIYLIVILIYLIKNNSQRVEFNFQRIITTGKRSLVFGLKAYVSNIVAFLNYRIDKVILNSLAGNKALGFYDVSVQSAESLWSISNAISTVIFPKISSLKKDEEKDRLTLMVVKNVFWATLVVGIVAFFLARKVMVLLYGIDFSQAADGFRLIIPGIIFAGASKILANDMAGRDKPGVNAIISIVMLAVNIIFNYLLIPRYGFLGASISSSISYSLLFLTRWLIFMRTAHFHFLDFLLIGKSDIDLWKTVFVILKKKINPNR